MKDQLRQFILENFMFGASPDKLDDEASFLDTGIIDSTGVMELIQFIEDEFGVAVDDTELTPDNLDSVAKICRFLETKGAGEASAAAGAE